MKKCATDIRLIIGFLIAHLLLFLTYEDKQVFWYIFTASMLFLISFSIISEKIEDKASVSTYLLYGIISGLVIYGIFWIGQTVIELLHLPFAKQIANLYKNYSPKEMWHYIVLILIIVPGEEIFWRGFIQKRLSQHVSTLFSIIVATILYASVQFYSGQFILVLAAIVGGLFWGSLYAWKKSIPLVIVSHLVFSLLAFVFLPFV